MSSNTSTSLSLTQLSSGAPFTTSGTTTDSGFFAALGYAEKSRVPFQKGHIGSHYVGKTFIQPSQEIRDLGVRLKLEPIRGILEGTRVVVVDDSIVRGTRSLEIVRLIKDAGAKEVHMRIISQPIV